MALTASIRKAAREQAKMDMTPMIDVTFLLLIFFMCTLHFKSLEGLLSSHLPKDIGIFKSQAEKKPEEPINIRLLKEGNQTVLYVGSSELKGDNKYRQLYSKISAIIKRTPNVPAIIDPDIEVPFQDIVATLNCCRKVTNDLKMRPIEVKFSAKSLEDQQGGGG